MDFANFTETARSLLQAAQMAALAGRHQHCLPEHLLKALLDDGDGLARSIVSDAGGDPDLLQAGAEERLARLPKVNAEGPYPIYMSPELAAVLQNAAEAAHAGGDKFVTAERLLAGLAGALGELFQR
ncbi:MAG: Clp protease N-terminal domain-containing protein, partial [Stellaceae bacterium]